MSQAASSSALAFAPPSSDTPVPIAGAVLLGLLLVGAAGLILWARSRRGVQWRAPWSALHALGADESGVPRRLSSVRLDAAHRLHVVAWDNRQFLIATGVNVAPVVMATKPTEPASPMSASVSASSAHR